MTEEWNEYRYAQARAWLEHVRRLGDEVATAQALVDSEKEAMDGLKGIDYAHEPTGQNREDAMIKAIERLEEHISAYIGQLGVYLDERQDAALRLTRLADASEKRALTMRYLLGKSWEEVCVEMGYTHDGMMKLRRRAIVSAYEVMPNDWRDPLHRAL